MLLRDVAERRGQVRAGDGRPRAGWRRRAEPTARHEHVELIRRLVAEDVRVRVAQPRERRAVDMLVRRCAARLDERRRSGRDDHLGAVAQWLRLGEEVDLTRRGETHLHRVDRRRNLAGLRVLAVDRRRAIPVIADPDVVRAAARTAGARVCCRRAVTSPSLRSWGGPSTCTSVVGQSVKMIAGGASFPG